MTTENETGAPAPTQNWEGAEEWMPLAWELCANECGEEACTELVWEGGPIPEPWGDRWLKYEDQADCNAASLAAGRPTISLINAEEEARIRELITLETWPQGWDGDEPTADTVMETVYQNGAVQPLLFGAEERV